ncbi:MAG: tetratricopeptide repeat protein [Nitrospirota bacterium]
MKSVFLVFFVLTIMIAAASVCSAEDLCYEYVKAKKYDDAVKECSKQINRETDVDDIGISYANRGIAYAAKGQYDQAIADYNTAINVKPGYEKAYLNRGNAYYAKGQFEEAIDDYAKVIELNPKNPTPYYNMACIYSIRACEQLRKSVENGFEDWNSMEKDKDLDNIRNSSCYREIMKKK